MGLAKLFISYFFLFIGVLVSVAFVTLLEQKLLASIQIRVGPNWVGYWGLLQPFADAVKLLSKEAVSLRSVNKLIFFVGPVLSLGLALVMWCLMPLYGGGLELSFGVVFFMVISGVAVLPLLAMGWSSNCKYSMLGSLRAVAQMISYEVSLVMVLLSVMVLGGGFNFKGIMDSQESLINFFLLFPISLIWFASSLAETNRTPYDFSEGESELVSGFNTEYSGGGFTLIFIAEYANILFMSLLFVILFLGEGNSGAFLMLKSAVVAVWFIWVRGTMPRYRYDKLMNLAWKSFLPVSLFLFIFYLFLGVV